MPHGKLRTRYWFILGRDTRPFSRSYCREPLKPPWRRSAEKGSDRQHIREETFRDSLTSWPGEWARVSCWHTLINLKWLSEHQTCVTFANIRWVSEMKSLKYLDCCNSYRHAGNDDGIVLYGLHQLNKAAVDHLQKKKKNYICFWQS